MTLFKYALRGTRSRSVTALLLLASVIALTFAASAALAAQAPVPLNGTGTGAAGFGALSFAAMTNVGLDTVVNGDVGSSTSIDVGVTHPGHAAYGAATPQLADAQASLLTAFNFAEAQTPTGDITGVNLAGATKLPGVYNSTGAILINGPIALTLDGGGNSSAVFIFQAAAAGDLTVTATSSVTYTNGAQPCNVFWKVRSAILQNTGNTFIGTILALNQITLTDNITVEGRVLARNNDVTFIHDTVNVPTTCASATPTPSVARQLYCDPVTFQSYDLLKGQDKLAPYAKLGLVLAYVDPVTGSQSCKTLEAIAAANAAAAAATAAKAAADAATAAAAAANIEAAKVAAAAAAEAAKLAATKAAEAKAAAAKAATAKAAEAAKLALAKAAEAKAAAVKAAVAVRTAARQRTFARRALRRAGFTG